MINNIFDKNFIKMVEEILQENNSNKGQKVRTIWADTNEYAYTIKKFGIVNRYDLSKEFPATTLRKLAFKNAIDEILWIYQKKSNNIKDLKSHVWDQWADEEGSIKKAYGYQLGVKHKYIIDGKEVYMDQVDKVLYDLKNDPYSRRIMTNLYNHHDLHDMALYPCAYSLTLNVTDGVLNAILNQRSQDILAANAWNVAQYSILVHMFARASGLKVGEFVHVIADAHIYDRHIPAIKELIKRPTFKAPKLVIDESITNFYDFTVDSFKLVDYEHGEQIKNIPIAK